MDTKHETVKLEYTIHKFSSYSVNFLPQCILQNSPTDGFSRWFTDSTSPNQYITLKLQSPAIVETIKFGKYIKSHVSNLKKFQILGGTHENNLSVLLQAGLKNDSEPEMFKLRHKTQDGLQLPVNYIQIVPLQSWGPAYNYSIWFVELMGKNQEDLIRHALETINLRKEEEAVRILLKHLRRRRYKDAFEALSRESGVQLEGPIQSRLWNALVEKGDFELTEQIFTEAVAAGELEWYLSWQPYTPVWRQITACSSQVEAKLSMPVMRPPPGFGPRPQDLHSVDRDVQAEGPLVGQNGDADMNEACGPDGCCGKPGPRGGHQLVVDSTTGTLYLYGGWNGTEDLDDLWAYSTTEEKWTLLCGRSEHAGGPGPRSCHKMVFDPVHRKLYVLGRYLDNAQRIPDLMKCELFTFDVSTNEWALVCEDTASVGGPKLVFDHQMCIDAETQTIYVFGGRILPSNTEEAANPQYSGLYAYYIATNTWQLLLPDKHSLPAPQSRVSHSMLFHPVHRRLYILAGQRNKQHLAELWAWDALCGSGRALCAASAAPPPTGFTQRATLDPTHNEIHVLAGMSKENERRVYNTLWVFSLQRLTWTCVYRNESVNPNEPRPRFAHQLVYDAVNKIHYLFGGNPGNQNHPRVRLDDLWSLQLLRPSADDVLRRASILIRQACYKEMCAADPKAALHYLRTTVNEAIDHSDPAQVSNFQKLPTALFSAGPAGAAADVALSPRRTRALARRRAEARASTDFAHAIKQKLPTALFSAGPAGAAADVALSPRRTRALARRRAEARASTDFAHAIKQVLGDTEESPSEPFRPFEEIPLPEPESWEIGHDEEAGSPAEWTARHERLRMFDELCMYFRPSTVPPDSDVTNLVKL